MSVTIEAKSRKIYKILIERSKGVVCKMYFYQALFIMCSVYFPTTPVQSHGYDPGPRL